jgi:hypothetical protein
VEQEEWIAANQVEHRMAEALVGNDGPAYARLLTSAPLFVPDLPDPGTEAAQQVAQLLPEGAPHVLVYTSPQTLVWAMGEHAQGYQQLDFEGLRQRWPDSQHHLAVNPGSPIGVFLPLPAVADLAAGRTSLVSTGEFEEALMDEVRPVIRDACLQELSGVDQPGEGEAAVLREDPPANQLEVELRRAVAEEDSDRYLNTLFGGDVVLVTAASVPDPEQIYGDEFPWRIVASDRAPSIALFSSTKMLQRVAAGETHRVEVPFIDVLANWPDGEYALCINPGSVSELILPPPAVDELLAVFDSVLEQHAGASDR